MKKPLLLFLILCLISIFGQAQKKSATDSLLLLINAAKQDDTTKVLRMLDCARFFIPGNLDSAEIMGLKALKISEKINFPYGIIRGYNTIATLKWRKNDIAGAKKNFFKAWELANKYHHVANLVLVGDNLGVFYNSFGQLDSAEYFYFKALEAGENDKSVKHYTKTLSDLASNYTSKGDYIKAIQYLIEAKKLNSITGDKVNQVVNNIVLGNIYLGMRDFDKAIAVFREATTLNDSLQNLDFRIAILQNTGLLYNQVKNIPDSARYYLNMARAEAQKNNRLDSYFTSMINLGNVEVAEKKYKKALEYYLPAYESPVLAGKEYERTAVLVNLGTVYYNLGDIVKGEKFAKEGADLAKKGGYRVFEQSALIVLSGIAAERNNFKLAYNYLSQAGNLKDSIWNDNMRDKVAEATFRLALKQAESENALLLKDVQINKQTVYIQWFIVGGTGVVLVLAIILMFVVIRNSKKQKFLNETLDVKNKQLQELNVTKDKFITIIAHDLKSPFNALLGFLTELDENYLDYDEKTRHDIIHKLKKSSYSTFNLLINLLDWSQSQQGKFVSTPKDFGLSTVLEEVVTVLSTRAVHKKQTISTDFDGNLVVHSDPQMVKSILINLINNAIKFTPVGGRIIISAILENGSLIISVEDSGIGIPAGEINNLFRLDSRFKRQGTEQEPGTGLGLVMCSEYVSMIGGTIKVTSEEGKGSKFQVTIPGNRRSPSKD